MDYGHDGTSVAASPTTTGYHFVKWSDGVTANPRTDTGVKANVDVTAIFAIDTHMLHYAADSNGSIVGSATQVVDYGTSGTSVTAIALAPGHHFTGWSDDRTDNPRIDTNVHDDVTVTAQFALPVPTRLARPSASPSSPTRNRTATFTDALSPGAGALAAASKLYLFHQETKTVAKFVKGKKKKVKVAYWRLRTTLGLKASSTGKLTARGKLGYAGKWEMFAAYAGSTGYAASTSVYKTFTVK